MIRMTKLCLLALSAVALCASVGQASVSDVSVLGNGSLTTAGGSTWWEGGTDTNIGFTWVDVLADDQVIDTDPTVDSASLSRSYVLKGWYTAGPAWTTTVTANFTIEELLDTDNPGDLASDDVTVKLELFGNKGTLIDSDVYTLANGVADGTELGPISTPVTLNVTTPGGMVDEKNQGTVVLTVEAAVSAFTAEQICPPDPDPDPDPTPVVPAPGAIVLASLGMGLVNWLRTRRTL